MKKKKPIKKAQSGYKIPPQEKDFVDPQAYQEALDQYLMGMADNGVDSPLPAIKPIQNPLQTSTSRFQELNQQTPGATWPNNNTWRDLSKPDLTKSPKKQPPTWGNTALTALGAIDRLIPEGKIKWPVVHPTNSYNQNQYGTGSQAIAEDGITVSNTGYKANSKDKNKSKLRIPSNRITMKNVPHPVIGTGSDGQQIVMMPEQEYLFPNAEYVDEQPLAKKGKRVKGPYISKSYKNGGELEIENNQFTPLSDDTIMINGKSHKNGGTEVSFGGKTIEAEAGEPAFLDSEGSLIIAGNLKNPLTGNKFKHDAKMVAKKEAKTNKLMDYSTKLVNTSDPYDKWENLKFNAGNAMMLGAKMKADELKQSKEYLSELQNAMLELTGEPQEIAKNGAKLPKAQRGIALPDGTTVTYAQWAKRQKLQQSTPDFTTPSETTPTTGKKLSVAQRHNNPGNMKFEKWMEKYGAIPGEPDKITSDGTTYAKFPDMQSGITAMKAKLFERPTYGNKTLDAAIKTWTGNVPYAKIPESIRNKKLNQMTPEERELAFSTFTLGEDSKIYNNIGVVDASGKPKITRPMTPYEPPILNRPSFSGVSQPERRPNSTIAASDYNPKIQDFQDVPVESDAEPLQFTQVLPEIYAAATNTEQPVWMQQYNPELFQDYEVSFQDRRNRIISQGRASRQFLQDNANAQAVLAAQEYQAINDVDAEEFRINQGIATDVTNKNKLLLNEAQKTDLQLADTQYTRQSLAKSKTKAADQAILNSVSNKVLQNRLENRTLQTYENLYPHFRYDDQYKLGKVGARGDEYLNTSGLNSDAPSSYTQSTSSTYNGQGELKSVKTLNPSQLDVLNKEAVLEAKKNRNLQKMFKSAKFSPWE